MCMIVEDPAGNNRACIDEPVPAVAEKDITVFKFGFIGGYGTFAPYYRPGYTYRAGKQNVTEMRVSLGTSGWGIHEGFHAYRTEGTFLKGASAFRCGKDRPMERYLDGMRTVSTKDPGYAAKERIMHARMDAEYADGDRVFTYTNGGVFFIPKGAKYYNGVNGEIVSEALVYLMPYSEWKKRARQ